MFSSSSFQFYLFTLRSLIHFNFCIWYEVGVQLHSFACGYAFAPTPSVEKTIPFTDFSWHPCRKSIDHTWKSLFLDTQFCSIGPCIYHYAGSTVSWLQICTNFGNQMCRKKARKQFSLKPSNEEHTPLAMPVRLVFMFKLLNCKIIDLCCFKSLCFW